MQKLPIVQSGSPQLLSPQGYYQWFQSHSGLQEKTSNLLKSSKQDRLNRVLSLYYEIAKKIIEDLKPQYVHDEETLNEYIRKLESRIDNKLRLEEEGNKFILIDGKYRFDGSDDIYEEYFQSGKKQFAEIVKGIASELRKTILGELLTEEPDKAFLSDISYDIKSEKKENSKTVAIDLDGTLIDKEENALSGAVEFLNKLKENGFEIVLYTARYAATPKEEYQSLTNYIESILKKNNLQVDRISIEKPLSIAFVDNSAINFNGNNYDEILDLLLNKQNEIAATMSAGTAPTIDKDKEPKVAGVMIEEDKKNISKSFTLLKKDEISKKIYDQIGKDPF